MTTKVVFIGPMPTSKLSPSKPFNGPSTDFDAPLSDVQWTVIWLNEGHVRAWTRVSVTEAADEQVRFVVRATQALAKASAAPEKVCVRLDPNGGRKMRSDDLTYPWAELKPCRQKRVEVPDPWWLAAPP